MNFHKPTLFLLCLCCFAQLIGQSIIVQPYLQNASANSITIMWEGSGCNSGIVNWGLTNSLGNITVASSVNSEGGACIYTAELTGLLYQTKYYYAVASGSSFSNTFDFITPELAQQEPAVNLVAMSDMQKDNSNSAKFNEIVNDGILEYVSSRYAGAVNENLQLVLIPGDLVDDGNNHNEWVDDFFSPSKNLFSYVPFYPVPGNHENNAHFFFDYFDLPKNGSAGFLEHWWFKDISNVRIIGLDSNHDYQIAEQLDWLDSVLNATAADTLIDFVFAQLHHPHHSELWPPGNTDFTGDVISLLENFSSSSGKPSIHFFGHTHGYSRGQSRDHNHLMVNVATAGGNIDYWDEYDQIDYPEYTVSHDDYGYVFVEVGAGQNPKFTIKRFSLGDENTPLSNTLRDSVTIKLNNMLPNMPIPIFPLNGDVVSPDGFTILGSPFVDADLDGHGATQWQISTDCNAFTNPVLDRWVQHENWYKAEDLQAGDNLLDVEVFNLIPDVNYCWRVRYRDKGLGWSDWSDPISFKTDSVFENWKIYPNPVLESATLNIPYPNSEHLTIRMFSSNGELIKEFGHVHPPVFNFNKGALSKGAYYLQVIKNNELVNTVKFIVAKDG